MSQTIKPAPVRKTLSVKATPDKAFRVFTERFHAWWPASHHIGASPMKDARIEPRVGGRWYEVGEDGAECDWGEVLAWDPPGRLLLAWRLNAQWQFDPALLTEVEVRFTAEADGHTRVEFEHRGFENMGAQADQVRAQVDSPSGWGAILASFQALADQP